MFSLKHPNSSGAGSVVHLPPSLTSLTLDCVPYDRVGLLAGLTQLQLLRLTMSDADKRMVNTQLLLQVCVSV